MKCSLGNRRKNKIVGSTPARKRIKIRDICVSVANGLWGGRGLVTRIPRDGTLCASPETRSFPAGELYERVDPCGQIVATNLTKNMLCPVPSRSIKLSLRRANESARATTGRFFRITIILVCLARCWKPPASNMSLCP